jgi:hypothetical protein
MYSVLIVKHTGSLLLIFDLYHYEQRHIHFSTRQQAFKTRTKLSSGGAQGQQEKGVNSGAQHCRHGFPAH